jgi:gas vesicle protein
VLSSLVTGVVVGVVTGAAAALLSRLVRPARDQRETSAR